MRPGASRRNGGRFINPDAATELWLRLLAGKEVAAEEKRDLLETLQKDEQLRLKLLRDAEFDGILRTLGFSCQDAEAFAQEFSDGRSAEDDAARFAGRVEEEINKPGNAPSMPWLPPERR